jgi:hypothetical protein
MKRLDRRTREFDLTLGTAGSWEFLTYDSSHAEGDLRFSKLTQGLSLVKDATGRWLMYEDPESQSLSPHTYY